MRQVDQHAQPVHLANDLSSELGEAIVAGAVHGGVGPIKGDVMGERHIAYAQVVVGAQRSERVLDGVATFDA